MHGRCDCRRADIILRGGHQAGDTSCAPAPQYFMVATKTVSPPRRHARAPARAAGSLAYTFLASGSGIFRGSGMISGHRHQATMPRAYRARRSPGHTAFLNSADELGNFARRATPRFRCATAMMLDRRFLR